VSPTTLQYSRFPPALVASASAELPTTSYLFKQALLSADNLDESDLGRWDGGPPFVPQPIITDDASEASFTERLVEVMHGRRLCQLRERDQMRIVESYGKSAAEVVEALRREIAEGVREWQDLSVFLPGYNAGPREFRMAVHYAEWCARRVVHQQHLLDGMNGLV
jgi:hypothetical protein